jgi:hypothetical protein
MPHRSVSLLRRIRLLAIVAAILLPLTQSTAQSPGTPAYDVELVIFRHLGGGGTPEDWGMINNHAVTDAESADPSSAETTFPTLPPERMKLKAIYNALKRSRGYQPLAHVGWTQPATDRSTTRFVSLASLGVDGPVSGRAALARGRFLHLTLDLALQIPGEATRYVLQQTRRMRSTEMHYIDHPRFGVVALITPASSG